MVSSSNNDSMVSSGRPSWKLSPAQMLRTAALAILVVCFAAATPSAFAQCPTAISNASPANNATNVATSGTLRWTTDVAADYFNVYFGPQGSGCANKFLSTSTGGKNFTINYDSLAASTTYEWRVVAVKNGCSELSSSCMTFTTNACSSQKATLINPQIDAGMADHTKVAFAWDPVFGATGYNVWVTTNGAAATNIGSTTGLNSTLLIKDVPPGQHTWWVETLFPGSCSSTTSDVWTFGTSCPTGSPQPQTPAAGTALGSANNVTFTWSGVSGADGYQVYVTSPGGSTATMVGSTSETDGSLAATTLTTNLTGGPGTYTWYVVATSSSCPAIQSGNSQFAVANNCPTIPPIGLSPQGSGVTGPSYSFLFKWTAVPNIPANEFVRYELYLKRNLEATTIPHGFVEDPSITSLNVYLPTEGDYTWYVVAKFRSCASLTSAPQSLNLVLVSQSPASCGPPTLIAPVNGQVAGSPVQFSWSDTGALGYIVSYWPSDAPAKIEVIGVEKETTVLAVIPPGKYSWSVQPSDFCFDVPGAEPPWGVASFVVNNVVCPTAAPTPTPIGPNLIRQIGDAPITFAWARVANATGYTVTIISGGQTTTVKVDANTFNYSNPAFDPQNGVVEWYVTANYSSACGPAESAHQTFTISQAPPCNLSAPILTGPADKSATTNQVVTFQWTAVPNAVEYRVYDNAADAQKAVLIGAVQGTSFTTTMPFGTHSWYVEAYGGARCTRSESIRNSIVINRAPVCSTDKAQLVTPANNSNSISNPVQFLWNGVNGASGYQLWASVAGGAPKALTQVLSSTTRSATVTIPSGDVQWFVRTFFPGCEATSSDSFRLSIATCPTAAKAAQLIGPGEGASGLTSPVSFAWTAVPGATSYDLYVGVGDAEPQPSATVVVRSGSSDNTRFSTSVRTGAIKWFVRASVPNCSPVDSALGHFTVVAPPACTTPGTPTISLQRQTEANQAYPLLWTAQANANSYEIQETSDPSGSFSSARTTRVSSTDTTFVHSATSDTTWYYRVRALSSCNSNVGEWSQAASIVIKGQATGASRTQNNSVVSAGSQDVVLRTVFVAGTPGVTRGFTATTDQPWMKVSPSSGQITPNGITLTLSADPRNLQAGTNAGNILLSYTATTASRHASISATTPTSIPVTVSLVSPVTSTGKGAASDSALVIPVVGSTAGVNNSFFQSDVRIGNVGADPERYNLFFTPAGLNGQRNAQQTTVSVDAGQTIALDDIVKNWYAAANTAGVLEIRQVAAGATDAFANIRSTIASSRTYTNTPDGTYGQYVPAVPFSSFVGKGETLTLLHLAQSTTYRTNLGLVEAAGEPAIVHVTAYNAAGQAIGSTDLALQPGEQHQYNGILTTLNAAADNVRIDLQVTSATGKIMGYASVVDNRTNDPMLVMPVQLSQLTDNEIVIPGVADLDGIARWRTDVRVYNAGAAPVTVTMTFYPSSDPAQAKTITQTINAGETKQLNDILRTSFNLTNSGGALHVTGPAGSRITASGRTYADTGSGTYGQFIPGVPHNSGIALDSAPLQVLQLEESPNYRSNVGIVELTGKPATVQITGITGDMKTATITQDLKAYQSIQLGSIFQSLFSSKGVYNARISVKVISGGGSVTAYGSVVDNRTQDPTYVPAQQ